MSDQFIYDNYFESIAPIWTQFFAGKMSLKERDEMLQGYRVILYREQQRRKAHDDALVFTSLKRQMKARR